MFSVGNEGGSTNLIFRLLQLSQARCVFVRFLPSAWAEAEAPRGGSAFESVRPLLVWLDDRSAGSGEEYFLFRFPPVVGAGVGGVDASAWDCCC